MTASALPDYIHKRGTTFSLAGAGQLPAGTWTARSQIRARNGSKLLATLVVNLVANATLTPPLTHTLSLTFDDTSAWSQGAYVIDIKFYSSGVKAATQTLYIQVVDQVTLDA